MGLGLKNEPTNREEFGEYCLRRLGSPVIEINVSDEQVDDRISDALQYYQDYHFEGTEKIYYKHLVTAFNRSGAISEVKIVTPGIAYNNADSVVFTSNNSGSGATANVVTDANGAITSIIMTAPGDGYQLEPGVTITTSTGSNVSLLALTGGYIPLPENIIGAINVFNIGSIGFGSQDIFNVRYQIALNDLYTLTSQSMVPYFMALTHISLLEELLVGKIAMRFNRYQNRVYLDFDWRKMVNGTFLIIEAYNVVDPDVYTKIWRDRWLQQYATCLIKLQWGSNLVKFRGMNLPGGVQFNGEFIYTEAVREKEELEKLMINSYSLPVADMIG